MPRVSRNDIFIVLGTKAQLVKMAPIMVELNNQNKKYKFIFTGQHQETIDDLLAVFKLRKPDYTLYHGKDVTKITQMFFWFIRCLLETVRHRDVIFEKSRKGIVLVHGDTFSTLLGAIMAKISGLKVGYVEAGLRSNDLFNPFPEEITRLIVSRITDYHFCQDEKAVNNSKKYNGLIINTQGNTLKDSIRIFLSNREKVDVSIPKYSYGVVSLHRYENIFNKDKFTKIIDIVEKISKKEKLLFILHKPTKEKLESFGLMSRIEKNRNIELRPRYDYFKFITLVKNSKFIITDGGSNQEECSYLNIPCIIMRKTSERTEGLGKNAIISNYSLNRISTFIKSLNTTQDRDQAPISNSPSQIIVSQLS